MTKPGKATATPRLRFPEFRGTNDWTTIELRQLAEFVTERVGTTDCVPYTITSGVGLVSQQEKLGRTIAGNSLKNYIQLQRNDFAYNKSATKAFPQGFIARYVGDEQAAVPNSIFTCFRTDHEFIDPVYLDGLFSKNFHGNWLRSRIAVGARAHGSLNVSDEDLMALPVPMPRGPSSLTEQQKIAECLTSLDEVISAQGRSVETLKAHKRGLMQQLFPREGETRPHLRLPEFRAAADWELSSLGSLVDFRSGTTPSKANPAFWRGSIPWVSAKDMKRLYLEDAEDHISVSAVDDGANVVPAGTLLLLTRGMTLLKEVPICVLRRDMSFNQDVKALLPKDGTDGLFVAFLLLGNKQRLLRMVDIAGHGTGKLKTDELKALDLASPKPAEQRRIAELLSSLETEIEIEAGKLAAFKNHKQALLQQLFPAPEGS